MPSLRALIVDDERLARDELRYLLVEHPEVDPVAEAATVGSAADLIDRVAPDVVFLDVQLRGESGFDLLRATATPFEVIFVTAHDDFAVRAFDVNALDYVLKPVAPDRLARAIGRLTAGAPRPAEASGALCADDALFLSFGRRARFVRVRDVVALNAAGDYSEVVTASGEVALVLSSLKQWEERLPERHFVRVHRSTIVNLDHVCELEAAANNAYLVYLKGQPEPVRMSRRYAARVKERMT